MIKQFCCSRRKPKESATQEHAATTQSAPFQNLWSFVGFSMLLAMGTILSNKYWWFQKFPKQCPSRKKTTGQSQQTDVFGLKHSPHHRPMEPAEPFEAEIKVSTWVTWGMSRDAKKKTFFFYKENDHEPVDSRWFYNRGSLSLPLSNLGSQGRSSKQTSCCTKIHCERITWIHWM